VSRITFAIARLAVMFACTVILFSYSLSAIFAQEHWAAQDQSLAVNQAQINENIKDLDRRVGELESVKADVRIGQLEVVIEKGYDVGIAMCLSMIVLVIDAGLRGVRALKKTTSSS